ncbi:hypothetical protein VCHA53O466_140196 [Vibrio chagasii]|nr:hypothetical protein VCHA53O466_140196 [Vibrio chagasii]
MDRQDFWDFVGQMRWGTANEPHANVLRKSIMHSLPDDVINDYSRHFFEVHSELIESVSIASSGSGSGSDFDDIHSVTANLIGFGLEHVQANKALSSQEVFDVTNCNGEFYDSVPFLLDAQVEAFCDLAWFWSVIARLGWNSGSGCGRVRSSEIERSLMLSMPPQELCMLKRHYRALSENLDKIASTTNFSAFMLTDDDIADLKSNIIGLGEEHYNKVIAEPEMILDYADDFKTLFFAAIPNVYVRKDSTCALEF